MSDDASALVKESARGILRCLRESREGLSKDALVSQLGVSKPSLQRALTWLRDVADSPVEFDRGAGRWLLRDQDFSLPLSEPQAEDLAAVMFAEALLAPLAEGEITRRVRRLAEQMDAEIRERTSAAPDAPGTRPGALVATVSTASNTAPEVLSCLLTAVARSVVSIEYESPWAETPSSRTYQIEPWQLRLHDGRIYLRAFSREHEQARSFACAHIRSASGDSATPSQRVPAPAEIWGDADPAFGIDHDRPDVAVLRVRGAIARWLHGLTWHPAQRDQWIEPRELLERRLPYLSCRELARRILSLGDAVESIEPAALRAAVLAHASALAQRSLEPT